MRPCGLTDTAVVKEPAASFFVTVPVLPTFQDVSLHFCHAE